MARFIRDILATLSHEPAAKAPADQEQLSRLDERLAHFAEKGRGHAGRFRSSRTNVRSGTAIRGTSRD